MQRRSVTSLETARSLANVLSGRGLRGNSQGIAASPISLLSMGGVCGRSLTAGKILFTGRQTCSLYLVLWLCGWVVAVSRAKVRSTCDATVSVPWAVVEWGGVRLPLCHLLPGVGGNWYQRIIEEILNFGKKI